jgi:hypothetical protein
VTPIGIRPSSLMSLAGSNLSSFRMMRHPLVPFEAGYLSMVAIGKVVFTWRAHIIALEVRGSRFQGVRRILRSLRRKAA